ncbi:MAG: ATP-binding protein [Bacteroidota bacterium]
MVSLHKIGISILIGCSLLLPAMRGQNPESNLSYRQLQFQHLTEKDGLADNFVHCALLDKNGYMWFGTHDGLSRWDGLEFKNFLPIPKDSTSIAGSLITSIVEDKSGYMWIVSHQGSLCRYNPEDQTFTTFPYPLFDGNISFSAEMKTYLDREGILWIGSYSHGFLKFNPKENSFKHYNLRPNLNLDDIDIRFSQNSVIDILEDISDPDILWLGGNDGLYQFNKKSEKLEQYPSTVPTTEGTAVYSLLMNQPDHLWLGTHGTGLVRFDIAEKKWNYFIPDKEAWKFLRYPYNIIKGIAPKSANEIWVNGQDIGAGVFNLETEEFTFFKNQKEDNNSIIGNHGWNVFVDGANRTWFFMDEQGISYLDPKFQNFTFYDLQIPKIWAKSGFYPEDFLHVPERNALFVLGDGLGGCYETDLLGNVKRIIPLEGFEDQIQIFHTILQTKDGRIIVAGNKSRGLNKGDIVRPPFLQMDENRNKFIPFQSDDPDLAIIQEENIFDLIEADNQHLWGATASGMLFQIDETNNISLYDSKKQSGNPLNLGFRDIIMLSAYNACFIASDRGLVRFDLDNQQFKLYPSTRNLNIESIQNQGDKLWLGTGNRGLKCFDLKREALLNLDTLENRPRVPVTKIFLDHQERLWCTTQRGLYYFNEPMGQFFHFGVENGLTRDFFYNVGVGQLNTGELLLGQKGGFYKIQPDKLLTSFLSKKLVFTNIIINEAPFPMKDTTSLALEHDQNNIQLGFSSLIFSNQEKVKFAYKMEGLDEDWLQPYDNRPFVAYNQLPPGNYTFKVKNLSQPNSTAAELPIRITPPFYQSWLAYLFYTLLGTGLIYGLYQRQLKRQAQLQEAQQLKEMDSLKTKLYANITHEFRTPLTLILGQTRQIQKEENIAKSILTRLKGIEKSGKQLLRLVNQLLAIRKLEVGEEKVKFVQKDIIPTLNSLADSFESLAVSRGIEFRISLPHAPLKMDVDEDKMQKIIANLISNAIKFSNQGGQVTFFVQRLDDTLLVNLKDKGIGIKAADLPKIFDRFYRADNSHQMQGTGIGLALTKELVHLLKGQINVSSQQGVGTEFVVQLPITNLAPESVAITSTFELDEAIVTVPKPVVKNEHSDLPIVLIVEDNADVAQFTASCLQDDYTIHFAENGQIGIEKAMDLIPDLIVSDVMMPQKDGFELCETLKQDEKTSHIPIILLTARVDVEDKIAGLSRGADAYLAKPFHEKELTVRMERLIQLREKLKERYAGLSLKRPSTDKSLQLDDAFVLKVRDAIEANLDNEQFGVEELSKAIFLSRAQVHRKMKALTGKSTGQFIHTVRLHHALQFLQESNKSITTIAFDVGYNDPSYFTRLFTREFGQPPSYFAKGVGKYLTTNNRHIL